MGDISELYDYDIDEDEFEGMVLCPYCEKEAEQVTGDIIYPHRHDLKHLLFYRCEPCKAYVGCHKNSGKPLGTLANRELRDARSKAHMFFDKLWRFSWSRMSRSAAYRWLANAMKIPKEECHIGMFDLKQCKQAEELSHKKLDQR